MKKNKQISVDGDLEVIEDRLAGMLWAYTLRRSGNDIASFPQAMTANHALAIIAKRDEQPPDTDTGERQSYLDRATVVYVEMQSSSDRRASSEGDGDDGGHGIGVFA